MRYVGLDVHKRIIQAHFCDAQGHKLSTMRFDLSTLSLQRFSLEHLGDDCAVALEATTVTGGQEAYGLCLGAVVH